MFFVACRSNAEEQCLLHLRLGEMVFFVFSADHVLISDP